jgi:hypothetical protein
MSEAANNTQNEFWRPPVSQATVTSSGLAEVCEDCGTEFMIGSRFCHICGASRPAQAQATVASSWTRHLEFHNIQRALGLSTASLVAFVIGIACLLGAIACGVIYSERNMLEWEAVQIFRIQWLLGAAAAFVAGILLKKSPK